MGFSGGGGSTIALSMLSLVGGMYLLIKSCSAEVCCKFFVKIVGWAIVLISILLILCSGSRMVMKCKHYGWGSCVGMWGGRGMMMKGMHPGMHPGMMQLMRGMQQGQQPEKTK